MPRSPHHVINRLIATRRARTVSAEYAVTNIHSKCTSMYATRPLCAIGSCRLRVGKPGLMAEGLRVLTFCPLRGIAKPPPPQKRLKEKWHSATAPGVALPPASMRSYGRTVVRSYGRTVVRSYGRTVRCDFIYCRVMWTFFTITRCITIETVFFGDFIIFFHPTSPRRPTDLGPT